MRPAKLPVLLAPLVALPLGASQAIAHEGKTPIHYVSEDGADTGDCGKIEAACATIAYAMSRTEKGDEVHVAGGRFDFEMSDPGEIIQLLGHVVQVKGSFDASFDAQDVSASPTILEGVGDDEARALESRGLLIAQAQSGGGALLSRGVTRYVTPNGISEGVCPVDAACTLDYALSIAEEGDAVLIASGDYDISTETAEALLRPDITVRGGYLERTRFTAAAPQTRPSYITGPSFTEREALAARGLSLIQDRKGLAIEESLVAQAATRRSELLPATPCNPATGMAGSFPCDGIDLVSHLPLGALSTQPGAANDIWGFVDKRDNREYAIMGLLNGTAVIDVTDPESPAEVGTIPGFTAKWRDIKVYQFQTEGGDWQAYAYVTADQPSSPQGLQIIDLSGLPASISLATTYLGFNAAHNIYIANTDYTTGEALPGLDPRAFILGSDLDLGAAHGLSLADPLNPQVDLRPIQGSQYAHDAASAVITDGRTAACRSGINPPASGHNPCELLIDYNENTLDLWDVTDPSRPLQLSSTTYADASYVHSGWVSEDTRFAFVQDELDEVQRGLNTTVRVFDISDLTNPVMVGVWSGPETNIDHNGFVKGSKYYMSAYRRGLSILDISNPATPNEVAFFDTLPSPASNNPQFNGAWGVYPYLPSGSILVSNIEDGLFVLREAGDQPPTRPEPRRATSFQYAAKIVCGFWEEPEKGPVVRGAYGTAVNIANIGPETIKFAKELALSIPPGGQKPGERARIGEDALEPTQAMKTDCPDINERVFQGNPPPFYEGFVVVTAPARLEVQAVYSATQAGEAGKEMGGDVDVETVPARLE